MATYSAHDVAADIRRRLPHVAVKKLHKLLYYCQGFHLAAFGEPLFSETIQAWDRGPVVAGLWRAEKYDPPVTATRALDQSALNTVGYVVSRYGEMTGADLERLTHCEVPWVVADARRGITDDQTMPLDEIAGYFKSHHAEEPADADLDDPAEDYEPPDSVIAEWLRSAADRRDQRLIRDDLSSLTRFLTAR